MEGQSRPKGLKDKLDYFDHLFDIRINKKLYLLRWKVQKQYTVTLEIILKGLKENTTMQPGYRKIPVFKH